MTKQEVESVYGQSIYEIQMSVATRAFALMVANRPIPAEFSQMVVTALNAATEFAGTVLGNPGPTIEPPGGSDLGRERRATAPSMEWRRASWSVCRPAAGNLSYLYF